VTQGAAVPTVAPAAVLRAALWPSATLDAFAGLSDRPSSESWPQAYEQALERDRRALVAATLEAPRFMRALTLCNPALAARAVRLIPAATRTKRVRQMETALFRYLARAVGRTVPFGAWAGSALVRWGPETRIRAAAAVYVFSPDLAPFQQMLRLLSLRADYREAAAYFLNRTLRRSTDGVWRFWCPLASGETRPMKIGPAPAWDLILRLLGGLPRAPLPELIRAIAARLPTGSEVVRRRIDHLVECGVLCSSIDLPKTFATPWEALEAAGGMLNAHHSGDWFQATAKLRTLCQNLAQRYEQISCEQLASTIAHARMITAQLADSLGLGPLAIPDALLRADVGLPLDVVLSQQTAEQLAQAAHLADRMLGRYGVSVALRRMRARSTEGGADHSTPLLDCRETSAISSPHRTWQSLAAATNHTVALHDTIERWQALLTRGTREVSADAGPSGAEPWRLLPPLGCLVVRSCPLSVRSDPSRRPDPLVLGGMLDHFMPVYSRGWRVFGRETARREQPRDVLFQWLRRSLHQISNATGLRLMELAVHLPGNPSILARPDLGLDRLDLFEGGAGDVRGWRIRRARGAPPVLLLDRDQPAAALSLTGASFRTSDPLANALLQTSFQDEPAEPLDPASLYFESEGDGRASPAVNVDGVVMRPVRWVLQGETLERLLALRSQERFQRWLELGDEQRWPRLVLARRDAEAPLLLPRQSPLAAEALFEGARDRIRSLIIEAPPAPWLVDTTGATFEANLFVAFLRPRHGWSPFVDQEESRSRTPSDFACSPINAANCDTDSENYHVR
jgi:hypothetical protein